MAIEDFFDHTCDLYHLIREDGSPGYGLPNSPEFSYPMKPDAENISCHFSVRGASTTITQQEPQNTLDATLKLTLPNGTDIRIGDKVVDRTDGIEYTAGKPRNIRGHHITVQLYRTDGQVSL